MRIEGNQNISSLRAAIQVERLVRSFKRAETSRAIDPEQESSKNQREGSHAGYSEEDESAEEGTGSEAHSPAAHKDRSLDLQA